MTPREPTIEVYGPVATHDMACAVYSNESAVLCLNNGVFYPSWKAQRNGWRLVLATSRFQRWLLRTFFKDRP